SEQGATDDTGGVRWIKGLTHGSAWKNLDARGTSGIVPVRPFAVSSVVVATLAASACGGAGGDGPIYGDDHPRIYLSQNADRLRAALAAGTPAATRFKEMVDLWVD